MLHAYTDACYHPNGNVGVAFYIPKVIYYARNYKNIVLKSSDAELLAIEELIINIKFLGNEELVINCDMRGAEVLLERNLNVFNAYKNTKQITVEWIPRRSSFETCFVDTLSRIASRRPNYYRWGLVNENTRMFRVLNRLADGRVFMNSKFLEKRTCKVDQNGYNNNEGSTTNMVYDNKVKE